MSYKNAFVKVSEDCPLVHSEVPVAKNGKKTAHLIQYELLKAHPYTYDHEGLIYEVFVRRQEIPAEVLKKDKAKIWAELFSKGHPCMRASPLIKRYGFGAHYDEAGKIAIFPMESKAYQAFLKDNTLQLLPGMRNKRA
jgi:hypothetical protein